MNGWLLRNVGGEMIPHALAVEAKAGSDRISDIQAEYHSYLRSFNVIVIILRTVDQGIADLMKYAGPGEK